jgi:hypothetical protein
MKFQKLFNKKNTQIVSGLISAIGSFGIIESEAIYESKIMNGKHIYTYENGDIRLTAEFTVFDNGAILRKDTLTNLTDKKITVNKLSSRFLMDGNEYEVYTQYSSWQHESSGDWQKLVTTITAETQGIRTCDGATPMLGLHNLYNGKNTVFHLIPNCQWKMSVKKFPISNYECVTVECGIQDSGLCLTVNEEETIELPEIIFFEAENKTDLDSFKLHEAFNELYPRRRQPVIFNSWLYCFSKLDVDDLIKQADTASEMGFDMFMIDAGWFGSGSNWFKSVGDWEENLLTGGPKGRLKELSDYVRNKGMSFGLWFEPERAGAESETVKNHPEYYVNKTFLNFADEKARQYILDVVSKQIIKYNIKCVKFDYNATMPYDLTSEAFYRYWQGYRIFIESFKARHPDVYMTCCGGGSFRMELGQAKLFDSFWFTDNQGPYEGIRIIKDTLKRMPSAAIERWNVQKYIEGLTPNAPKKGLMIHCNNATWDFLIGVNDSFSEGFTVGGPIGFSCDIAGFSNEYKERWKKVIAEHKLNAEFFTQATARILVDSDQIIAIQYSDKKFNQCLIQIFTKVVYAYDLTIYPIVDKNARYSFNERVISGESILTDGLYVGANESSDVFTGAFKDNACITYKLNKIITN